MRRTNPDLREALQKKLGVSQQRVSQLAAEVKKELPMQTPDAVYALAFEAGIDIASYLTAEETGEVRKLVGELRTLRAASGAKADAEPARGKRGPSRRAAKPVLVSIGGISVERLPGMSATRAREARTMAEKVYPLVYVFENSARALISSVMEDAFGPEWWDQKVSRKIRDAAAKKKADEQKDPWHGRRGSSMIDYTLLSELPAIVKASDAWPLFEPIFERQSFFEELVNDINVSRRVIAHMNPVSAEDVRHIEAAFRKWSRTLKAKKNLIPRA